MITDEQVKVALSAYFKESAEGHIPTHRIEAMRSALVEYEQSKWIKFDVEDKSTHPNYKQVVLVSRHD